MYALLDFGDLRFEQQTEFSKVKVYYEDKLERCPELYFNENIKDFFERIIYGQLGRVGLRKIIVPDGATTIEEYAFDACGCLKSVIIPNSLTSIGSSAFSGCTLLENIEIPNSVTYIGEYAFAECIRLTDIILPDSAVCIEYGAFLCCESLTHITIPDGVNYMGCCTFSKCKNLETVIWRGKSYIDPDKFNKAVRDAGIAENDVWMFSKR